MASSTSLLLAIFSLQNFGTKLHVTKTREHLQIQNLQKTLSSATVRYG